MFASVKGSVDKALTSSGARTRRILNSDGGPQLVRDGVASFQDAMTLVGRAARAVMFGATTKLEAVDASVPTNDTTVLAPLALKAHIEAHAMRQ